MKLGEREGAGTMSFCKEAEENLFSFLGKSILGCWRHLMGTSCRECQWGLATVIFPSLPFLSSFPFGSFFPPIEGHHDRWRTEILSIVFGRRKEKKRHPFDWCDKFVRFAVAMVGLTSKWNAVFHEIITSIVIVSESLNGLSYTA